MHAVVDPLVEGEQPRLFLRRRVRRAIVRRRQLTRAAGFVDEMPDLGNPDVRHEVVTPR